MKNRARLCNEMVWWGAGVKAGVDSDTLDLLGDMEESPVRRS